MTGAFFDWLLMTGDWKARLDRQRAEMILRELGVLQPSFGETLAMETNGSNKKKGQQRNNATV